jgi:hypothetical protein
LCAATKFMNSIEHSGRSGDDYVKAAVDYYVKNQKTTTSKITKIPMSLISNI